MSIIKEKVRFNNNDIKIKFTLGSRDNFTGYQQEIDKLTQFSTFDVVNPAVDGEITRIKYFSTSMGAISFQFFNNVTSTYVPVFPFQVFNTNEITGNMPVAQNSFFVMDIYDRFTTYNKNKLSSSYISKVINDAVTVGGSTYRLYERTRQFNKIVMPNWFINQQTTNEITVYAKFNFYNAKTGGLIPFINFDNRNLTTPERDFVKIIINIQGKTFRFDSPSAFSDNRTLILREVVQSSNSRYIEKLNNTVDSVDEVFINLPTGNTFNFRTRDYEIT